jgi:hypothetical protein
MIINQRIKCLGFLRKLMCSYRASKIFSMAVVMMLFSSLLPSNPFIPSTVSFVRADPAVPDYLFELTIKPDIQDVGNDPLNPSSRSTTYEIEVRNFDTNPNQIKLTTYLYIRLQTGMRSFSHPEVRLRFQLVGGSYRNQVKRMFN